MGLAVTLHCGDFGRPRRVAVFRALNLGDMLCSMPAFKALRAALPGSHIALIGLPSSAPLVNRHRDCIDEFLPFPGDPALPEQPVQLDAVEEFRRSMAIRCFDVILQMHGSGLHTNRIVRAMPARRWAGFVPEHSMAQPGRLMPWPDDLPETERYLALLRWLGMPVDVAAKPSFPLMNDDLEEAAALMSEHGLTPARMVVVHPGARLASRRWPIERHAAVAGALAREGWQVAVTGDGSERHLGAELCSLAGAPVADLCGRSSLGGLAALLRQSRLLVCNDTGVSHVAAAVGARSVVIASGSDVRRWAPGDRERHIVLHWDAPCRPCLYTECPYAHHPCARGVSVQQVLAQARRCLEESVHERACL